MKYFSISSVEEAYKQISASTREKFWGILGILHSINETIIPNKYYSVETGILSQYFEDLFRLYNKKNYSSTDKYSFVFSNHWVEVISQDYLLEKPDIKHILIWAYRNHVFETDINITELFNIFLNDYHITKETAEHLFKISFSDKLEFDDSRYSENDLILHLGGSPDTERATLKLGGSFVVANPGDLSRGPFFQPLYAALNTLRCITIYPFNIYDYYNPGEYNNLIENSEQSREEHLQQIFYGAPGTGKSNTIKREVDEKKKKHFRTTFHPDSDYSTFVGAYKPTMDRTTKTGPILDYEALVDMLKQYIVAQQQNITKACTMFGFDYHDSIVQMQNYTNKTIPQLVADGYKSETTYDSLVRAGMSTYENSGAERRQNQQIVYSFVPQAFTKAYIEAWNTEEEVYLIIEEINRGNCAQIFGDLFQLLDRDKNGESEYPIDADADLANYIADALSESPRDNISDEVKSGKKLKLPRNLYIWATMNTSDQSLFPIDSAFKRRWNWTYIPISNRDQNYKIKVNDSFYDWWEFLKAINGKIWDANHSEDKKLGYFFVKADDGIIKPDIFVGKVIFYLWNDVFKDFIEESGGIFNDENGDTLSFDKFYETLKSGETKVVEKNVEQFLKNLGLTPIEISSEYSLAKFCLDGGNPLSMTMIAKQVVINFADSHTSFDANAIRDEFNTACDKIVVETESEFNTRIENNPNTYHGQEIVLANGEKLYVTNQWQWKSEQSNFAKFIRVAHERNWGEIVEFKQ